MARCGYCGTRILFGGVRDDDRRYCDARCRHAGTLLAVSQQVPDNVVQQRIWELHQGTCPKCHGRGPVDIHASYWVWSALVMTKWGSAMQMSCRACATKTQLTNLGQSLVVGWWGFPWGLILTPVQVSRNLMGIMRGPDPTSPSPRMERLVRLNMAAQVKAGGQGETRNA